MGMYVSLRVKKKQQFGFHLDFARDKVIMGMYVSLRMRNQQFGFHLDFARDKVIMGMYVSLRVKKNTTIWVSP